MFFFLKAPFRYRRTAPKEEGQLTVFGKLGTIREHCTTPHNENTQLFHKAPSTDTAIFHSLLCRLVQRCLGFRVFGV